jgi:F0F1-type ATP synthase alpha subunit
VGQHLEIGVAAEAGVVQAQRVDVGHQMAAVAIGPDQLHHAGVLVDDRVGVVGAPPDRQVRDAHFPEDLVPKVVGQQHLVDGAQEVTGFRALDDAVVVGRGQRDQLADTQFGDAFGTGAL